MLAAFFLWGNQASGQSDDKIVHAVFVEEAIQLDGKFDEPAWSTVEPADGFIQQEPRPGEPATEPTEVRILYDNLHLYIGVVCFDSAGAGGVIVNDLSRDFDVRDQDSFEVIIDTFNDRQNGVLFATNPMGAQADSQVTNDGSNINRDWDTIWRVQSRITEQGWQAEIAIPFRTLRFAEGEEAVWGINFQRRIRRKTEDVYWSPIPRPFRLGRVSYAGQLTGIHGAKQGRNLYLKPFVTASVSRLEDDDVDGKADAGFDVKWSLTSQLTLDLSANTDFSQVEADEEQVNLTRFSLFFPEKREFFLENAGFFEFGEGVGRSQRGPQRPDLVPFFSRRIGISEDSEAVPVMGGARLTGRAGAFTLGMLNMQTDDFGAEPSTNFSVVRVRRDVFGSSNVGVLFVNKEGGGDYNRTYGFDANLSFFRSLSVTSFLTKTQTPELAGKDAAGKFEVSWQDPFWRFQGGFLSVEENFNPEVGFVRREGIRKSYGEFGFALRPEGRVPWVREISPAFEPEYITDQENLLLTREVRTQLRVQFEDNSRIFITNDRVFERLDDSFDIRDDLIIPVGDYNFSNTRVSYRSDESRMFSGEAEFSRGGFFNGDRDSYELGVQVQPNYRLRAGIEWEHNDIILPDGSFSTDLVGSRLAYSFNTRMFINALIQYNSERDEILSNIRFNLIHRPLSDLFIVYNERRIPGSSVLDRALIVKYTHLIAF